MGGGKFYLIKLNFFLIKCVRLRTDIIGFRKVKADVLGILCSPINLLSILSDLFCILYGPYQVPALFPALL
jgi:hypothetical protein